MAESAFQAQYRQQMIQGYETRRSLMRQAVTTEHIIQGNQAIMLVVDSGGARATTRGLNGRIVARPDNLNNVTVTLREWHDLVEKTRWNIFASQGNQRALMQQTTLTVMNHKVDEDIITELDTATQEVNSAGQQMSLALATKSFAILTQAKVPIDGNIWGAITPAALAYLLQQPEFTSADFVNGKPLVNGGPQWDDQQGYYNWMNIKWFVHPDLPGVGTADAHCFVFHKGAIAHAMDAENFNTAVGYNEEQDYSYARTSTFMGSKLLQNSGVVMIHHDDSAMVAV